MMGSLNTLILHSSPQIPSPGSPLERRSYRLSLSGGAGAGVRAQVPASSPSSQGAGGAQTFTQADLPLAL